jgi:hypothetical protein
MKKYAIIAISVTSVLALTAFNATVAGESNDNTKSVAWYVANVKAAKMQNQECHDNPSLQSTPNCENSLHALQIMFKGGN